MRCNYCEWRCELKEGNTGVCGAYIMKNGAIKEKLPHYWSSLNVVHIESLPFYHAYPGSRSLSIGSSGCNFDCSYCSNSYIARVSPSELYLYHLGPKQIIKRVRQAGCHNIVFALNEPIVSLQSLQELGEEAEKAGIPLGCMTNGYMTPESAELLSSICSFINISLKSISSQFYQKYTGISNIEPILRNIIYFADKNHLELTTPIIQSINDHEIDGIAAFIYSVNPQIPWHIFRLLPEYKMKECQPPSINDINTKLEYARELLPYIYFGNFVGSEWVSTLCPGCGKTVIERINLGGCGGKIIGYSLDDNKCPDCGQEIPIYGKRMHWNESESVQEVLR